MRLETIGRRCLREHGHDDGGSTTEVGRRLLQHKGRELSRRAAPGAHSTDDFPLLLADARTKALLKGYNETPRTFLQWASRGDPSDYRDQRLRRLGETPTLAVMAEGAEFPPVTMIENQETWAIDDYGSKFVATNRLFIHDDLGAFLKSGVMWGGSAARAESDLVYSRLTANAGLGQTMADAQPVASAAHVNLDGDTLPTNIDTNVGVPSAATIATAQLLMRLQTGLDATTGIDVVPGTLLAPETQRHTTEQLFGLYQPTTAANAVTPEQSGMQRVYERRLDASSTTAWWIIATPQSCDGMVYGWLAGVNGVQTASQESFQTLGWEIRAWDPFGAGVADHRAFVRNNGA
jgi:hypothetical protein